VRDGGGEGLGTTGPNQVMAATVDDRGTIELHTRMSIKALRNLFFVLLCQNGRRVWSKHQRVNGEQAQRRTCRQGIIMH
jgi:hypothetical protein